ncbi:MAG: hypothetical protein FIB00_04150 [Chloroflexi bacterium]|nr:hypothetical protein [Chloroflexota bacterium]
MRGGKMVTDRMHEKHRETLSWLARLPFLSGPQLALLLGMPSQELEDVLRGLRQSDWIDWIEPSSPELVPNRRYALGSGAWEWLTAHLDSSGIQLDVLPSTWADTIRRIASIELTSAVNQVCSTLVAASHRVDWCEAVDARALPLGRRAERPWPPDTHARVAFSGKGRTAEAFLTIVRKGVPAAYRDTVVANWYRHCGYPTSGLPVSPMLVVCADQANLSVWSLSIQKATERRGATSLPVYLACAEDIGADLFGLPSWRAADGAEPTPLGNLLSWRTSAVATPAVRPELWFADAPSAMHKERGLYEWARSVRAFDAPAPRARRGVEQVAALALAATAEQKRLLEAVGRYPLLSKSDLALVLGQPHRLLHRALERSITQGLVEAIVGPATGGSAATEIRFVMTELGLRLVAARERTPARRYHQDGPMAARFGSGDRGRLQTLIRQYEHTVGSNRFFLSCLTHSRPGGPRLREWRGVAEAAVRFDYGGVRRTFRPDGTGEVVQDGFAWPFFLEWDRGTERIAVLLEKLDRYAAYYRGVSASQMWPPCLLVVCQTQNREGLVWKAIDAVFASDRSRNFVKTTSVPLLERRGPFGSVWRAASAAGRSHLIEETRCTDT